MSTFTNKEAKEKVDAYFLKEQPFKKGINTLREITLETGLTETCKWGVPVYTIDNKNIISIVAFKHHYGIWFYNGVFLRDPLKVLENAQEGKTKAMRHWKFTSNTALNKKEITAYLVEAIAHHNKGNTLKPTPKENVAMPVLLAHALANNPELKEHFEALTPYKQKEYKTFIAEAKRETTKQTRLKKSISLILKGSGLHDRYRK